MDHFCTSMVMERTEIDPFLNAQFTSLITCLLMRSTYLTLFVRGQRPTFYA